MKAGRKAVTGSQAQFAAVVSDTLIKHHSEPNVNTIGAKRRQFSDFRRSVRLRKQNAFESSGAKRRETAASAERGAGKGRHVLSPPQHTESRSAISTPNLFSARPSDYPVIPGER